MAEESTRRLLRVFGVAVTEFEDRCQQIVQQAHEAAASGTEAAALLPALEQVARSSAEVASRLLEVAQFIVERHTRTCTEILGLLDELKRQGGRPS